MSYIKKIAPEWFLSPIISQRSSESHRKQGVWVDSQQERPLPNVWKQTKKQTKIIKETRVAEKEEIHTKRKKYKTKKEEMNRPN